MATSLDALQRTTSSESVRSNASHHLLSTASSSASLSRKGRHLDADTSGHGTDSVERASLSMPMPLPPNSNFRYHNLSRCGSRVSDVSTSLLPTSNSHSYEEGNGMSGSSPRRSGEEDGISGLDDVMRRGVSGTSDVNMPSALRSGEPDLAPNRMSFSSLYNYARSMNGPASATGSSDIDGRVCSCRS